MPSMRTAATALLATMATVSASRVPSHEQTLLDTPRAQLEIGVGHFSEWSRATKKEFLIDWQADRISEWTLVQGNEGGDLDSMAAALAWAYHLEHSTQNTSHPRKAIALLQTPTDALDLRPENKLALDNSQMTTGHSDLLTIDELPEDPETLSRKIRGVVLVDHPEPLQRWDDAEILSVFDHHEDRGAAPDAEPRIFERTASCTTLVARQMLDELEALPEEYHMPHELLELILSAIAIDSSGLKKKKRTETDVQVSTRVLARSAWRDDALEDVMADLDDELSDAQDAISTLGLRDLLRRDWKSGIVHTTSPHHPDVHLGFASIPYSFEEQIEKTEFQALFDWFAIEAAWTAETGVDIAICLTKYKTNHPPSTAPGGLKKKHKKTKVREIVLVVRDDVRIDGAQADELYETVFAALEESGLDVERWEKVGELGPRQMVWRHYGKHAGRKVVRPIVEKAVTKLWH